jgi:hypothetical protein
MSTTSDDVALLYELYKARMGLLVNSDDTLQLRVLNQSEFEQWLIRDWRTPRLKRAWLARFIRGHEKILDKLTPDIRAVFLQFEFAVSSNRLVA